MPIREWQRADIPAICMLLQALNQALQEDQLIDASIVESHFAAMANNPEIYQSYVFVENSEIKGFVAVVNYRSIYHKKGTALVSELVVKEGERGKGIGGKLLRYCMQRAREQGMDEIEVAVMKDNPGAIAFYKQHGLDEEYYLLGKEFDAD
ncbi:MAG: GNAT family N-acetyltransferase [Caldilineaceae bacterium]|nr:GNAT family N-acetyltransferase [Caldilineaceae bacterium]